MMMMSGLMKSMGRIRREMRRIRSGLVLSGFNTNVSRPRCMVSV